MEKEANFCSTQEKMLFEVVCSRWLLIPPLLVDVCNRGYIVRPDPPEKHSSLTGLLTTPFGWKTTGLLRCTPQPKWLALVVRTFASSFDPSNASLSILSWSAWPCCLWPWKALRPPAFFFASGKAFFLSAVCSSTSSRLSPKIWFPEKGMLHRLQLRSQVPSQSFQP